MQVEGTRLADLYSHAKAYVVCRGFGSEIDWQDGLFFDGVTESNFLAEAAWVVLASGMRETIVRKAFSAVTVSFGWWESAAKIAREPDACVAAALGAFNHRGKIAAIATIASRVDELGFDRLKAEIAREGVPRLREFPYMGPATSFHLAKNLGMDVVKPDRHLLRIAQATGYPSPDVLCRDIAREVGDRISVVDLVLWRFATLVPDYPAVFSVAERQEGRMGRGIV